MKNLLLCVMGLFMATAHCSEPELTIIQKPIQMNDTRTALTLEYLKQRYGIEQKEPTITPTMVVVHWTVIPTLEQTFAAFDPAELPAARDGIRSGGQLTVSGWRRSSNRAQSAIRPMMPRGKGRGPSGS